MHHLVTTLIAVAVVTATTQARVLHQDDNEGIVFSWSVPGMACDSGLAGRKVVYTMTNTAPNSIIAVAASANGSLYPGSMLTSTGGDGGNLVNSKTGKPDQPDSLSSQDSIVVAGDVCVQTFLCSDSLC